MRKSYDRTSEMCVSEVALDEPTGRAPLQEQEDSIRFDGLPVPSIPGVTIGILAGFEEGGTPLVTVTGMVDGVCLPARSVVELSDAQIGNGVALAFEQSDLTKPVIMGCLIGLAPTHQKQNVQVFANGAQLTLSADREIVLRCGKSSITLTRAGKIIVRGAYVLSRSSGVNRIQGGSVQIN
jgi:hypothetical protein